MPHKCTLTDQLNDCKRLLAVDTDIIRNLNARAKRDQETINRLKRQIAEYERRYKFKRYTPWNY